MVGEVLEEVVVVDHLLQLMLEGVVEEGLVVIDRPILLLPQPKRPLDSKECLEDMFA